MEGPVDGHIYATINSLKCDLDQIMMSSPQPVGVSNSNHSNSNQPQNHRYHQLSGSSNHGITIRNSHGHGERRMDPPDSRSHSNSNHTKNIPQQQQEPQQFHHHQHSSRKYADNDINYYSSSQESSSSKRVTPMWSPSSDNISSNNKYESLAPQQASVSHPLSTQTEIDKLDDLLQELTPRLNDSPSEYLRRRRQSFSNSTKSTTFEGRGRQDTFIQGFSPTSPFDSLIDAEKPRDNGPHDMVSSTERSQAVERICYSQSNVEGTPNNARYSNWHSEEKRKLQRARSLLDEKDRFLTEQLRRIQTRPGLRDSSTSSPLGYRPGSSQQMIGEPWVDRYSSFGNKNYTPVSEWEDVRSFSDQCAVGRSRRATSELEYPLREVPSDRRNQSPLGALVRRRPLLRNFSDTADMTQYPRNRYTTDNIHTAAVSYRAYSPHLTTNNSSSTAMDLQLTEYADDIPQVQRRNIRSTVLASRLLGSNAYQLDSPVFAKIKDRNLENLPVASNNIILGGGVLSPIQRNADPSISAMMNDDMDRGTATPELLKRSRHAGFQIRGNNPLMAESPVDKYPSHRDRTSSSDRVHDPHNLSNLDNGLSRRDSDSTCLHQNRASSTNSTKPINAHNISTSSIRKSSKIWYQPNMSRDEGIEYLKTKPPGTFVVRQSHTFNNSYGLAVKVSQTHPNDSDEERSIRHFLIESNNKGVRIRGCTNEPYFGSLTALVHQHTLTKLALPCCIILPCGGGGWGGGAGLESDIEEQQVSFDVTGKTTSTKSSALFAARTFVALYLGSIDTDHLTGPGAIAKAVEVLIENRAQVKQTEVSIRVSSDGVTLTDVLRKLFFRRHYPLSSISYSGTETNSSWDSSETRSRGIAKARIFGFVARKTNVKENMCHMLCECNTQDTARSITTFIAGCLSIS